MSVSHRGITQVKENHKKININYFHHIVKNHKNEHKIGTFEIEENRVLGTSKHIKTHVIMQISNQSAYQVLFSPFEHDPASK